MSHECVRCTLYSTSNAGLLYSYVQRPIAMNANCSHPSPTSLLLNVHSTPITHRHITTLHRQQTLIRFFCATKRQDKHATWFNSPLLKFLRVQTRKDVGAECRHDTRPSVQLPSVSGVDSKLGLTMVRPSLQSAPEPPIMTPHCC